MLSETKVDHSLPDCQFFLDGFGSPFRLDRNRNGGGIMLFIRSDIPAKVFSTDDRSVESHLGSRSKSIDSLSSKYDNFNFARWL